MLALARLGVSAPKKSRITKNGPPSLEYTPALEPMPMLSSMRPMAGAMPSRMPSGMASTIFSRTLSTERMINTIPSMRMTHSAVWNDCR